MSRLTLRDKPPLSSSGDETEVCSSPGKIVFEYFEQEQPHHRQPLYDKASWFSLRFEYSALSPFIFFCPDLDACLCLILPADFKSCNSISWAQVV